MNKNVFSYWDGTRWRWGDPIAIYTTLASTLRKSPEEELARIHAVADGLEKTSATGAFIVAARVAFGMVDYNSITGTGATHEEVMDAISALWEFFALKKKSVELLPISSGSTVLSSLLHGIRWWVSGKTVIASVGKSLWTSATDWIWHVRKK